MDVGWGRDDPTPPEEIARDKPEAVAIVEGHETFRRGEEKCLHAGNVGTFTLHGEAAAFIGFGGLARSLKPLLAHFSVRIRTYDPWLPDTHLERQGVVPVDFDALLRDARVILVLAIPSPANEGMYDVC